MAAMTIRNIDDALKQRLRIRVATHGRSMQNEARDILRAALTTNEKPARNVAEAIGARLTMVGGIDLHIPAREAIRDTPDFGQ
jgi:plasmid stability protein